MSQGNVEVVVSALEKWNSGDDTGLAAMSGHSLDTMLGTYTHALERSHDAVRELLG
jgi:hypothetical protein